MNVSTLSMVAIAVFALSACGSRSASSADTAPTETTETAAQPVEASLSPAERLVPEGSGVESVPASEVEWVEAGFGPFVSPVFGNLEKGEHMTLVRFPAGLKADVHTHTGDYVGVVIEGVTRHYESDDGDPIDLPAGSHWSVEGGESHISECVSDNDCVMALFQREAFDFLPEEHEHEDDK